MAKRSKPRKPAATAKKLPAKLPPLTPAEAAVLSHVLNSIAFHNYSECCAVEEMAKALGRTPGRLTPTLKKLEAKGYLSLEGTIFPAVYPTVEAVRKQDPSMSAEQAERLLAKLRTG